MNNTDTIAAAATAVANAGIGIIRISGDQAVAVADRVVRLKAKGKKLSGCESHTIHYGFVMDGDQVADEVMAVLMKAPRSYTREDTVEINCHGGTLVMKSVLELIIKNGARPAEPGEFTKRAFLNGRIDLAQAESVLDLIKAGNDFAWKASMEQLKGSLSDAVRRMRAIILHEIAFIESAIDDPEHYPMEGYGDTLLKNIKPVLDEVEQLLFHAEDGAVLKEGIHTVIAGKPNSGKSSLLNALSGRQRAIVTDIAGTTRDAIEEQVLLRGIELHVTDTAGIRNTNDPVEKIGVETAKEYIERSDLIIYVADASAPLDEDDKNIIEQIKNRNVIVLLNKSDLPAAVTQEEITALLDKPVLSVSAKFKDGIEDLADLIEEMFLHGKIDPNHEIYITNIRHKNALTEAKKSLLLVKQSVLDGMPEDFYSIDLMNAYEILGSIVGEAVEDDLVNEIFSKFCMGK